MHHVSLAQLVERGIEAPIDPVRFREGTLTNSSLRVKPPADNRESLGSNPRGWIMKVYILKEYDRYFEDLTHTLGVVDSEEVAKDWVKEGEYEGYSYTRNDRYYSTFELNKIDTLGIMDH